MKTTSYVLSSIIVAFCLCACSDVLDGIKPKNAISTSSVGTSDINKLTNGVLYTMESYFNNFWLHGDVNGEALGSGPGFSVSPDPLLMTPSSNEVASRWQNSFTAMRQVNELLDAAKGDSETESNARKTAYFFRAYIYFNMVIRWEKAPLLSHTSNEEVPLSEKEAVYDFIIANLEDALAEKASKSGFFYVTDSAVKALYAKVCLWKGDKQKAVQYASEVIDASGCKLAKTSEELASTWVNGTSSSEIVFALANLRSSDVITLFTSLNDTDASWNYSIGDAWCKKDGQTITSINMWDDVPGVKSGDIRRAVCMTQADLKRIIKFPNGNESLNQFVSNPSPTQSPLVIIRIAEMYLVKAEAQGNTTEGKKTLEEYMKTRYATVNLPATMTQTEWEDLLLDENVREFLAEGHRWFDVKRMGRLDKFKTLAGRDYLMKWPIPQREIDLLKDKSKYPQNDGYGASKQ